MINGNEYSWEDIQVVLPGSSAPVEGVTAIEYTDKKDHVNIYGRGGKPIAMGRGKHEFSGSVKILQSQFEAMQQALPKGRSLTQLSAFNITVSYAPEGGAVKTDLLKSYRFGELKKGMKTGDPNMEIELALVIGDIAYNV